jgi:hypothetical protein
MEHNDPYDKDLNELLKKYLLEAERDRLADEALEMHAGFVFSEEPEVVPTPAREQELINALNKRAGIQTGRKGKLWKGLMALSMLLILCFISIVIFNTKTEIPTTTVADNTITPQHDPFEKAPPAHDPATIADNSHEILWIPAAPDMQPPVINIPPVENLLASVPALIVPGFDLRGFGRDLSRKLSRYVHQLPAERIYVHTDREVYQPGQDIFFALYLRNENDLKVSNLSEVVKVQLTDPDGKAVSALQLATTEGLAQGNITLANGLAEGVYRLSAYTNWQQNTPSELIFEKEIMVNEPQTKFDKPQTAEEVSLRNGNMPVFNAKRLAEFYPEGGDMIAGLKGKVAFALYDTKGQPVAAIGYISDSKGNRLTSLSSDKKGLGWFELTPAAGESYTAHIKVAGNEEAYPLPAALNEGITLAIEDVNKDEAALILRATQDTKAIVFAQVRGTIYFNKIVDLQAGDNELTVPLKNFPAGTAQFTVFNAEGEPVAERPAFVNLHKQLKVSISTDKKQYGPREKVKMTVNVTDDKGEPVQGQFSLAVKDDQPLSQATYGQGNIISKLLLEPNVNGLVEDAAPLLNSNDPVAERNLDLLLMTRGWRKFSWNELLNDQLPALKYSPEKKIFSAIVVDEKTGQPLKGVKIKLNGHKAEWFTDKDGRFSLKGLDLRDYRELTLSYKIGLMAFVVNRYEANLVIPFIGDNRRVFQPQVNNLFHPVVSGKVRLSPDSSAVLGQVTDVYGNGVPYATLSAKANDKVIATVTSDVLGFYAIKFTQAGQYRLDVFAQGYKPTSQTLLVKADNAVLFDVQLTAQTNSKAGKGINNNAQLLLTSPDKRFSFLSPELRLLAAGDKNTILERAPEAEQEDLLKFLSDKGLPLEEMTYYLDGMKVTRNEAQSMSLSRLKGISSPENGTSARYAYGPVMDLTSKGAILGSGWMDDLSFSSSDQSTPPQFKPVYHKAKEFPKVTYPVRDRPVKPVDFRNTLYWNGNVTTDKNGNATVEFFTSDDITTFRAVVEGISDKGMAGTGETAFSTYVPFGVQAEVPQITEVTKRIKVPVTFFSTTGYQVTGKLEIRLPDMLRTKDPLKKDYTIFPAIKDTIELDLEVLADKPAGEMLITFIANGYVTTFSVPVVLNRKNPD